MSDAEVNDAEVTSYDKFVLPAAIVSKVDLARLAREFENVDNLMTARAVRSKTQSSETDATDLPSMSPQLQSFLDVNPVNLDDSKLRSAYIKQLRKLKDNAKVVNMTFAVVADPESLQQLASWLRESIHPQAVIESHLQPALVAGVYVRTPNHVFDLSVRNALKSKRVELKKALGVSRG